MQSTSTAERWFAERRVCARRSALGVVLLVGSIVQTTWAAAGAQGAFWEAVADPGYGLYLAESKRARRLLVEVDRIEGAIFKLRVPRVRNEALARQGARLAALREQAVAALRAAVEASPRRAQGHLLLGKALYGLNRCTEALASIRRARSLDPGLRSDISAAFSLGICHSKVGMYAAAVREYERIEAVYASGASGVGSGSLRSTALGNAAESLMALGRIEEAIARYRQALHSDRDPLLRWGLAVALDRDEQMSRSSVELRTALGSDGAGMRHLTRAGVFFVPEGDLFYYLALGYRALGRGSEAKANFERFLRRQPTSLWRHRARAHLEALTLELRVKGAVQKRAAPRPPAGSTAQSESVVRRLYRQAVHSEYYAFQRCYRSALRGRTGRPLHGTMKIALVVGRAGKATSVKVVSSSLPSRSLVTCVVERLRHRYFGRPGAPHSVRLVVPLSFEP